MTKFEIIHKASLNQNNPLAPQRYEVSGKHQNGKDDVIVAMMENLYYSALVLSTPSLCPSIMGGIRHMWAVEKVKSAAPGLFSTEVESLYVH
jgi:hypothetical protein